MILYNKPIKAQQSQQVATPAGMQGMYDLQKPTGAYAANIAAADERRRLQYEAEQAHNKAARTAGSPEWTENSSGKIDSYTVADMAPGTGEIADLAYTAKDLYDGNYGAAAISAGAFFLPGVSAGAAKRLIGKTDDAVGAFSKADINDVLQKEMHSLGIYDDAVDAGVGDISSHRFKTSEEDLGSMMNRHEPEFIEKHGGGDEKSLSAFARYKEIDNLKGSPMDVGEYEEAFIKNVALPRAEDLGIVPNLTKRGEMHTDFYTRGYDNYFNGRANDNSTLFKDVLAPELEEVIKQTKLKKPTTVYRGVHDYTVKDAWDKSGKSISPIAYSELKAGDEYLPDGFMSTSFDKDILFGDAGLRAKINVPEGQSALYPNATNVKNFVSEDELVLPGKLRMKIDKVNQAPDIGTLKNGNYPVEGGMEISLDGDKVQMLDWDGEVIMTTTRADPAIQETLQGALTPAASTRTVQSIVNPYSVAAVLGGLGVSQYYKPSNEAQ